MMNLPLNHDFTGKVVVITGAGGVLCGDMTRAYAAAGAKVAALDLNEEAVRKLADELKAEGYVCEGYKANVLDREALEAVHRQVLADLGPCDILINGAGGNNPKATTTKEYFSPEDLDDDTITFFDLKSDGVSFVFNLNFLGTLIPSQVFLRDMVGRKGCTVVNISSMNAFTPLTKIPAYSAAKAGISNFTQWMAVHFSKVGIRVNALAPGFFITNQNRNMLIQPDGSYSDRAKKIIAGTPMERFGEKEELIGTLLYLLNEKASGFVTGVVIPVDGGYNAYSGV